MFVSENTTNPILSVVIPVKYGSTKLDRIATWATECATLPIEVIMVGNFNFKSLGTAIEGVFKKIEFNGYKLIENTHDKPGISRNIGINHAKGEWVSFWDSDDLPKPKAFFQLITETTNADRIIGLGSFLEVRKPEENSIFRRAETIECAIFNPGLWRFCFKRELATSVKFPEWNMAEDQYYLLSILEIEPRVYLSRELVYEYFQTNEGQLTKRPEALHELYISINTFFKRSSNNGAPNIYSIILVRQILTYLRRGPGSTLKRILRILKLVFLNPSKIQSILNGIRLTIIYRREVNNKLIVALTGGFGNQLFQLAYGLATSEETNSGFYLDSSLGTPRKNSENNADLFNFNLPSRAQRNHRFLGLPILRKIFAFLLSKGPTKKRFYYNLIYLIARIASEVLLSLKLKGKVKVFAAKDLGFCLLNTTNRAQKLSIGYFQSHVWVDYPGVASEMSEITIREKSSNLESLERRAKEGKYLFVHIRLTDYLHETEIGVLGTEYYVEAINHMMQKYSFDQIWIFTDQVDLAKKRVPSNFEHQYFWVPANLSSAESWELMRYGSGYVIANSSYSWWAAKLSKKIGAPVASPYPWFAKMKDPALLIPAEWERFSGFHNS